MAVADNLNVDNDYYIEVGPLAGLDVSDGSEDPATGWTDLQCKVCATAAHDAAPIHATLDVPLTEEGTTATYRGSIAGADLSAQLVVGTDYYVHMYRADGSYHVVSKVTATNRLIA